MIEIKNAKVLDWVKECAELTNPKEILWIDGSEQQLEKLREEACQSVHHIKKMQDLQITGFKKMKCMKKCARFLKIR